VWIIFSHDIHLDYFPEYVRPVQKYSIRGIYDFVTANVWINDSRMDDHIRKRKGQKYIQTWHGGFAMKKVEADNLDSPRWLVSCGKRDSKMADLFISNSKIQSEVYHSSFWYDGPILEIGYPRNDYLVSSEKLALLRKAISERFNNGMGVISGKKILLYAPTFRKGLMYSDSKPDFMMWLEGIRNRFGDEWIIFLRLHPNIVTTGHFVSFSDNLNIFDVSLYPDMQELLAVADVLVTDYSSSMFDFGLTKRPCFLYAPDVETYASDDRGFYIQLSELPFPLYKSNEELMSGIESFDSEEYQNNLSAFYEKYGSFEKGDASKKVVDWILSQMS
ncbi:CDP-glycerol glycerophosphotransferase family protein, partial [Methanocorpusculum sp.]|nr:CDP-glycerol glycerophosphotransferase family protein [Methanocorpusculum sp.]